MKDDFKLRPYQQRDIMAWIKTGYRGAWFWDPGLGKTFAGSYCARNMLRKKIIRKVFISGPAAAIPTWYNFLIKTMQIPENYIFNFCDPKHELRGYSGEMFILCNYEKLPQPPNKKKKKTKLTQVATSDGKFRMTSRAVVDNRKERIFPMDIDLWILDESHKAKSYTSIAYLFFKRTIKPEDKLLLMTGTPFPNRLIDSFAQMDLIHPGVLGKNISAFRKNYCVEVKKQFNIWRVLPEKSSYIESVIARYAWFKSAEVYLDIPDLTYSDLIYTPTDAQEAFIKDCSKGIVSVEEKSRKMLLKTPEIGFMIGQQALSGYVDMTVTPKDKLVDKIHIEREFSMAPKMDVTEMFLESLGGKKVIIWIYFKETARRVGEHLASLGYKVDVFTSKTKKNLEKRILKFTQGDVQILVSHPAIIGIAMNYFTPIQYMLWYELTWDWGAYHQCVTRIYRSGQRNPTFCYHLLGHDFEEKQVSALKNKQDVHEVLSGNDPTNQRRNDEH